ncbi:hypothetical protein JD844_019575 [Phrynosoma platyrhinos]|uniref:Uncharacterized protein n=1 Tax=Phrynosoma platyrhinos TaxID=52577 RepID=A0ABQ7TQ10_PHRPL|nr:hypothetical protein JD844_019575 [Phrynosoma platyrhinos]
MLLFQWYFSERVMLHTARIRLSFSFSFLTFLFNLWFLPLYLVSSSFLLHCMLLHAIFFKEFFCFVFKYFIVSVLPWNKKKHALKSSIMQNLF